MPYYVDNRSGALTPPCKNCGSTTRFRFDRDSYEHGKPFCACEKGDIAIGGIRSREGGFEPMEMTYAACAFRAVVENYIEERVHKLGGF